MENLTRVDSTGFLTYINTYLLTLLSGALLALAFAPFDYYWLGFVSLVYVFSKWTKLTPAKALIHGFLFGLGLFGVGVSWVFVSVYNYGSGSFTAALLVTVCFISFWSIWLALTGFTIAYIKPSKLSAQLFFIPAIWVIFEYIRGRWILNGFPWLQLAYSQLDSPLSGYVPVMGAYGTSFLVAFISMCLTLALRNKTYGYILFPVIIFIFYSGYLLKNIEWSQPVGNPLDVSIIQGNISQDQKWAEENRIKTLFYYKSETEKHLNSDVVVWPETSIPAYYSEVKDDFLIELTAIAKSSNTDIIVSLPIKNQQRRYNALMVIGDKKGIYRKNHLLPFGEYLPFQPVSGFLLKLLKVRIGQFTSGGDDQELLIAGGMPFLSSICYEDVFPMGSKDQIEKAAFLINVTNDGWFGDSIEPYQHMQIARMRALESGRFLIRATNTGQSGIVDAKGNLILYTPVFKALAISGNILPMVGVTPYRKMGDTVIVIVLLLLCALPYLFERLIKNKKY